MLDLRAAERMKLVRHKASWGLVWIFPLGLTLLYLGAIAWRLTHPATPLHGLPPANAAMWIRDSASLWKAPGSGPGRCLIGAFAALAFGGEYGWNTWKLVAPHRSRVSLLVAKYVVVLGMLMFAFVLMAALGALLGCLKAALIGPALPAGISLEALLGAHARAAVGVFVSTLLTVAYASAGALLLRSAMAGTVAAVAAVILEGLAWPFAPLLNRQFYLTLPSYHVGNLKQWINDGSAQMQPLPSGLLRLDWSVSLAVIALWIVLLIAVAITAFQRQDLN